MLTKKNGIDPAKDIKLVEVDAVSRTRCGRAASTPSA